MTSALRGKGLAEKQTIVHRLRECDRDKGEGSQNPQNFVDVICEWTLWVFRIYIMADGCLLQMMSLTVNNTSY